MRRMEIPRERMNALLRQMDRPGCGPSESLKAALAPQQIIVFDFENEPTIEFKKYDAGRKKRFQGAKITNIWMDDGPEYYKWWQMPLFWWRVLIHQLRRLVDYVSGQGGTP